MCGVARAPAAVVAAAQWYHDHLSGAVGDLVVISGHAPPGRQGAVNVMGMATYLKTYHATEPSLLDLLAAVDLARTEQQLAQQQAVASKGGAATGFVEVCREGRKSPF